MRGPSNALYQPLALRHHARAQPLIGRVLGQVPANHLAACGRTESAFGRRA